MQMSNSSKSKGRNKNYLPETIGSGIEKDFRCLIQKLSKDGSFKNSYLEKEVFSKYLDPKLVTPNMRLRNGIQKWISIEVKNEETNQRLLFADDVNFGWVSYEKLKEKIRKDIAKVFGKFDPVHLFSLGGSHTNGASTRVRRGPSARYTKHTGEAHGTASAIDWYKTYSFGSMLYNQQMEEVSGSMMFTVNKKTEIDRVACKEPEINMFLQRCVGQHLKGRLLKNGIDLRDQTVNQELAKVAVQRGLATVDLSAASDSISAQLVREFLPNDWFEFLDDIRVKQVEIPETFNGECFTHDLEMFSSMGNGFTFELETLIFWAITRAVSYYSGVKGRISVYGDDIICPTGIVPRLQRLFHFFGFRLNEDKSFWSGEFRESCGYHYHGPVDVTPFYLRGPLRDMQSLIRLLNQLLNWDGRGFDAFVSRECYEFHKKWSSSIPKVLHGGDNIKASNQLVTIDFPVSSLEERSEPVEYDEIGAHIAWHAEKVTYPNSVISSDPKVKSGYKYQSVSRFISANATNRTLVTPVDNHKWNPYLFFE